MHRRAHLASVFLAIVLSLAGILLPGVAIAGVEAGQVAPGLELPLISAANQSGDAQPESMSLAQLRGKIVYLDFWASWCGPCRTSFPQLEQLRTEFAPQGFEVLAVSVDEFEADALAFLQEIPVSYPVVHDAAGATPQAYGILGMPSGYLIDREGVVRWVHQGFRKNDGVKLRAKIAGLLGEK